MRGLMQSVATIALTFSTLTFSALMARAEEFPTELCNPMTQISTMFGKGGPLKNCRNGDVVHFIVDATRVSPAAVAARYCSFDHQIMTDTIENNPLSHVVCVYQWKWAKDYEIEKHPDAPSKDE